jgi:hypothetical protein
MAMTEDSPLIAAEIARRHRQSLEARLKRVEEALRRWDEWETAGAAARRLSATAAPRRAGGRPPLARATLDELRTMLARELTELGGEVRCGYDPARWTPAD